ncbi:Acetylcholinesterase [Colletotrichum trifolii]|uniref:Carboxylic ester hydrolase n=1 Tax=Colletotrichum trifolii TaxID=5466 RepID=A0A4R8Q1K0_COLTR|nr:Acetylcholinesterase [Colletotrichum trifolii]
MYLKKYLSHTLAAFWVLAQAVVQDACASPDARAELKNGVVTGFTAASAPSVAQFLGIPYAEAPVGPRRWLPALARQSLGAFDASKRPSSCPQTDPSGGRRSMGCRVLDQTQQHQRRLSEPQHLGAAGLERDGRASSGSGLEFTGAVLVSYRLGLFGFPHAAGLDPKEQNLGLLDQRLAVEWVRDNIAHFGGDPARILLWGQSAGAAAVSYYQYAYYEDDHRHRLHQELCIALHPDRKLRYRAFELHLAGLCVWPAIIGSTRDEWNFSTDVPVRPSNTSDVPADDVFGCPAHYETALRNVVGLETWRYMYSGNFTNIMPGGPGAHHSAELPLIFGTHDIARGNSTVFEDRVSDVHAK